MQRIIHIHLEGPVTVNIGSKLKNGEWGLTLVWKDTEFAYR